LPEIFPIANTGALAAGAAVLWFVGRTVESGTALVTPEVETWGAGFPAGCGGEIKLEATPKLASIAATIRPVPVERLS
jgi:hypothetical protein